MLHDPTHTTGLGDNLHRRGPRSGPDLTHKRAHTSAPYGLLVPHHQTPNSVIPTKTHTSPPTTHQGVTSQVKVLLYSIVFGVIAAMMRADLPFNRPGRPAIEMNFEGIYFCRSGRHPTCITWDAPSVMGCKSMKRMPRALIESGNGPSCVATSSLPIGYAQLIGVTFLRHTPRTSSRACVSAGSGTGPGADVRLVG